MRSAPLRWHRKVGTIEGAKARSAVSDRHRAGLLGRNKAPRNVVPEIPLTPRRVGARPLLDRKGQEQIEATESWEFHDVDATLNGTARAVKRIAGSRGLSPRVRTLVDAPRPSAPSLVLSGRFRAERPRSDSGC